MSRFSKTPDLLVPGFKLVLRNWPLLAWAYVVNLVFGLLAGVPLAIGLTPYLDHSLAAQKIAGTMDITYLAELAIHLHDSGFFPAAVRTAGWLDLIQGLLLFLLFAGAIFVYVSGEPPRFSVLLRGGVAYFWRFVRAGLAAACVSAVVLGILLALRWLLLFRAGAVYVERKMFLYSAISGVVVVFAALLVRLWWDLIEVYLVRHAMDRDLRVREALLPAAQLLFHSFFPAAGSFLLIGLLGLAALGLCVLVWRLIPADQVWLAGLLAQLGLLLLLATRFWQRGMETALVMSADPARLAAAGLEATEEAEEPRVAGEAVLAGLPEPTLRDLVNKLRSEPWANPPDHPTDTPTKPR